MLTLNIILFWGTMWQESFTDLFQRMHFVAFVLGTVSCRMYNNNEGCIWSTTDHAIWSTFDIFIFLFRCCFLFYTRWKQSAPPSTNRFILVLHFDALKTHNNLLLFHPPAKWFEIWGHFQQSNQITFYTLHPQWTCVRCGATRDAWSSMSYTSREKIISLSTSLVYIFMYIHIFRLVRHKLACLMFL